MAEETFGTEKSNRPPSYTSTAWDWVKGHADAAQEKVNEVVENIKEIVKSTAQDTQAAKDLEAQKKRVEGIKKDNPKRDMGSGANF